MTKADLVEEVARVAECSRREAVPIVETVLRERSQSTARGPESRDSKIRQLRHSAAPRAYRAEPRSAALEYPRGNPASSGPALPSPTATTRASPHRLEPSSAGHSSSGSGRQHSPNRRRNPIPRRSGGPSGRQSLRGAYFFSSSQVLGFHSRAKRCASATCSRVISTAIASRISASPLCSSPEVREVLRLSHMWART